jgi:hypothetical protein
MHNHLRIIMLLVASDKVAYNTVGSGSVLEVHQDATRLAVLARPGYFTVKSVGEMTANDGPLVAGYRNEQLNANR